MARDFDRRHVEDESLSILFVALMKTTFCVHCSRQGDERAGRQLNSTGDGNGCGWMGGWVGVGEGEVRVDIWQLGWTEMRSQLANIQFVCCSLCAVSTRLSYGGLGSNVRYLTNGVKVNAFW